jgi:hypothetical protein
MGTLAGDLECQAKEHRLAVPERATAPLQDEFRKVAAFVERRGESFGERRVELEPADRGRAGGAR